MMATLEELATLPDDPAWGALVKKVTAACVVKAADIIASATPGEAAKGWAISCLSTPGSVANQIVFGVVGANDSATTAQILSAPDAAIQSNVSTVVDKLYGV